MDRSRIEAYVAGGKQLCDAYAGLNRQDLLATPIPGTWSLQQIAIHMMDSDLIGADRMKRIAAMEKPLLIGYDETAFANLPGTNEIDAMEACRMFADNRRLTAIIFRSLPDESFQRWGIHNESGKVTLAEMIDKYIDHLDGHLVHVRTKREMLGRSS
jgi:DinB superfamily